MLYRRQLDCMDVTERVWSRAGYDSVKASVRWRRKRG